MVAVAIGGGAASARPSGGALPPVLVEVVDIAGLHGVPVDAKMVAVNVTAVSPAAPGWLKVYPCDQPEPETSNVNYFAAGQVVPNLVISRIADDGTICISTLAVVDLVVDINGYVPAESTITPLTQPFRFLDTRTTAVTPIAARQTIEVPIAAQNGVPPDANLVMLNATAVAGSNNGFLKVYPCGASLPATSSLNYRGGTVVANTVISRLSTTGTVCIFTLAAADIIVDVSAYGTGGLTMLATPERVIDTRDLGSRQPVGGVLRLDVAARFDVPDDATAAVYNLTSTDSTADGFATSYPCDEAKPLVSNLNYSTGVDVANAAITKLSTTGQLCVYTLSPTHLVIDLIGYTQGNAGYVPIAPARILDTREGWQPTCNIGLVRTPTSLWVTQIGGSFRKLDVSFDYPVPTNPVPWFGGALIAPNCTTAYVADQVGLWLVPLDGTARQLVRAWPVVVGEPTIRVPLSAVLDDGTPVGERPSPDGIVLVDLTDGTPLIVLDHGYGPQLSRDGSTLLVGTGDGWEVWDIASGELLGRVSHLGTPWLSPDGKYLLLFDPLQPNRYQIKTIFGDVVDDVTTSDGMFWPKWASPGVVMTSRFSTASLRPLFDGLRTDMRVEPVLIGESTTLAISWVDYR
jgi:hypothetical protein